MPTGLPPLVSLDPAVCWVEGRLVDTRELECSGVDPGAVTVSVPQAHRTVGDDGVEWRGGRNAAGNASIDQPPPVIQSVVRVLARVAADDLEVLALR